MEKDQLFEYQVSAEELRTLAKEGGIQVDKKTDNGVNFEKRLKQAQTANPKK